MTAEAFKIDALIEKYPKEVHKGIAYLMASSRLEDAKAVLESYRFMIEELKRKIPAAEQEFKDATEALRAMQTKAEP